MDNETLQHNLDYLKTKYPEASWSVGHIDASSMPVFKPGEDMPSSFVEYSTVFFLAENGKSGDEHRAFPVIAGEDYVFSDDISIPDLDSTYASMLQEEYIGQPIVLGKQS